MRKVFLDGASWGGEFTAKKELFNPCLLQNRKTKAFKPVLFSRGKVLNFFFTEDSKMYLTPREQKLLEQGIKLNRTVRTWDGLSRRIIENYQFQLSKRNGFQRKPSFLEKKLFICQLKIEEKLKKGVQDFRRQWTLQQLWNFSIIGAVLLGMVSMTLIYKFLGPGALAGNSVKEQSDYSNEALIISEGPSLSIAPELLEESGDDSPLLDDSLKYIEEIVIDLESKRNDEYERRIREMVKGYPIEKMVPEIVKRDRIIAALLIGIAKKESNWGKRVPVLNGEDCFNYWGYRGIRKRMGTGGHTCFDSPEDAVDTVAKRLETLVQKQKRNTPEKLIIWKCGSACDRDDPKAVRKWISDVEIYFSKLNK